jgi:murein L,D-transpeptidase YcbB/YkuD
MAFKRTAHWRLLLAILGISLAGALPQAAAGGSQPLRTALPAVNPALAGDKLRGLAAHYRELQKHWSPLAEGETLRPGDRGPRVAQLRALLQLYGDYRGLPGPVKGKTDGKKGGEKMLPGTPARHHTTLYDSSLQRAVENFQRRHGLEPTGITETSTLEALKVPPRERARQLELNAGRWDKLPIGQGDTYVLINVPDYRLQLVRGGRVALSMKTVVGRGTKRTPQLNTRITSIVFNPTWTVPRSILLTELLPKARNNPEAMHKRGYRVVNYRGGALAPISPDSLAKAVRGRATLRQLSGAGNTLGRVKFVLPNNQSIFLHDTQARSLFEHRERAFSHGCIRLQRPEELAYALLGPQGWDRTRVAQATTGDEMLEIKVENPPPLYITYITAWVDPRGQAQFRPDIYHRDESDKISQ